MTGLTIRQPWAWAILHAGKRIENRSWRCKYRGPLLIHAAKGMTKMEYDLAAAFIHRASGIYCPPSRALERGGFVGICKVVDCVSEGSSASFDPWFCGPWGIVLDEVRSIPFEAAAGSLGLFTVQPELAAILVSSGAVS